MGSKIGNVLWNACKLVVLFFVVGALLSYALPTFAGWAVPTSTLATVGIAHEPLYLGLMFAGFGALDAVLHPVADWLFDGKKSEAKAEAAPTKEPNITINIAREPSLAPAPAIEYREDHAAQLAEERTRPSEEILPFKR